jgi:alpha-glucosidase (family GH31 glycosyl hydrolase)
VSIYLPDGKWIDYWTKQEFDGPRNLTYHAPLDVLPLFVRADSIIPMGPEISYVGEKPLNPITLDIYCYKGAKFVLYDDGGNITFECAREPDRVRLNISASEKDYIIFFNRTPRPSKVFANERELQEHDRESLENVDEGWSFDAKGYVVVKVVTRGAMMVVLEMGEIVQRSS